ncbi:MAG: ATPase domain-containing protein [Streptosporangiaceae bacterium]
MVKRINTGVAGLDLVLDGGLEPGAVVVVAGAPGTGKTILAQQMCFALGTAEHKSVYYTTVSEPHTKLVRHLEPFTFFDAGGLGRRVEHIHLGDFLRPGRPDGLTPMVTEIVRKTLEEEPAVVVLDSAKMLSDFVDERELRGALYDLNASFAETDAVLLLVGEYTPQELGSGIEFSLADGIIQLEYQVREPIDRRSLRVVKMRGGSHVPGRHTFQIGAGGIRVFPRIETLAPANVKPLSSQMRSGIAGLDELMPDGMRRGDATLVMGPSGVGKTTLGMGWIAQGLAEGEHCLFVTFQDTVDNLVDMGATFGWDLAGARASGHLVISYVSMGDLDLDVLADAVRTNLAEHPISRVAVDSLAELVLADREWNRFPAYMRSLVGLVRAADVSLLATSETTGSGITAQSLEGLMFLFDNVIDLRYIEEQSTLGRALNVVKMRNSAHKMTLNSAVISEKGLVVGGKLDGVSGRLGWSALRAQDPAYLPNVTVPAPARRS